MALGDGDFADGGDDPIDHEADEEGRLAGWLSPDDRLWRHPSEMAGSHAATSGEPPRGPGNHRWAVTLSAGVAGALIATGAVVGVHMAQSPQEANLVAGHPTSASTPVVPVSTDPTIKTGTSVMAMAHGVSPDLVAIEVDNSHGGKRGSGVIYRSDGVIITTQGLVQGATDITVVMSGGQEVSASLMGTDPSADLAVVRVEATDLPTAELASSQNLRVGQLTVAVTLGDKPDGSAPSVYLGTVRALDQQVVLPGQAPLLNAIETDAPVHSDSEGGVLLDEAGRIVGLTSAHTSAGAKCVATPANVAAQVADQILQSGQVVHTWLGIEGQNLSTRAAANDGVRSGVQVVAVQPSSPAATSGLRQGDDIVSINASPVSSMLQLQGRINLMAPGTVVNLGVDSSGQQRAVPVTLGSRSG
ncbi:MAG: S1C family serine protease [Acidimicrobiales bacterium]